MTLRMRVLPRFPAKISAGAGIKVDRTAGSADLVVSVDVSNLIRVPAVADGDKVFFLTWNSDLDSYSVMSFTDTFAAVIDTTGLMLQTVYDPQGIEDDAFDRANHTGEQDMSTITGLAAAFTGVNNALAARVRFDAAQMKTYAEVEQARVNIGLSARGWISPGFNLSNNASDPTNDIDFPAGSVASDDAVPELMLHNAGTSQLDVAFGSGNGGRFDSVISDGWWHCFVISNGTTRSRGFSKSLNPIGQPNYPSGFTKYRRVMSIFRTGGVIKAFKQDGDRVIWSVPVADVSANNPGAAAVTRTLTVPTGFPVLAVLQLQFFINAASTPPTYFYVSDLALADATPSVAAHSLACTLTSVLSDGQAEVMTNSSGQVRSRVDVSGTTVNIAISTMGYIDTRGRI